MFEGLNKRDRLAVLVLALLITGFSLASYWIGQKTETGSSAEPIIYPLQGSSGDATSLEKLKNNDVSTFNSKADAENRYNYQKNPYSSGYKSYPTHWSNNNQQRKNYSYQNVIPEFKFSQKPKQNPNEKVNISAPINLNDADSATLLPLPCIGPALASRIIKYRNRLGGFYSIEQLKETYGITDSTFQIIADKIIITPNSWKKISINSITLEELKLHPYFKWDIAKQIINYRNANGPFHSLDDFKKIIPLTEEIIDKFKPYLEIN